MMQDETRVPRVVVKHYSGRISMERKRILITGGTSGIGLALARAWLAQGEEVVVCGGDPQRLEQHLSALPGLRGIRADITLAQDRRHLVGVMAEDVARPLTLVNNAGVQHPSRWTDWSEEQAARGAEEIATNVSALVLLTHAMLPHLLRSPTGTIVNLSSGLALAPRCSAPVYCATKAFVRSFTRALRDQCDAHAPHVRVVEVLLPLVDTPMTAGRGRRKLSPDSVASAVLRGLARDQREIRIGAARALPWLMRLSPSLGYRLLRNA